ncbi:MAG: lamin tail domain-containing protein, partial [Bacteroidota bacterium]|nr:lamin tail domain-containing protein [Bacteroidota bacterium]
MGTSFSTNHKKKFTTYVQSLFFLSIALFYQQGYTQDTTIDFETPNSGYTPSTTTGSGFADVFNVYDGSSFSGGSIGGNSSNVWAAEDISGNPSITLDQISVAGATSFDFSIDMLAHHYNDWDSTDEMLITYSTDGGVSYSNLMWVQHIPGGSNSSNEPVGLDTDFDGNGECGADTTLPALTIGTGQQGCEVSSNIFKTFTVENVSLNSGTTLDIKLQFNSLTANDEGIYLDNIVISQNQASSNPIVGFDSETTSENENNSSVNTTIPVSFSNHSGSEVSIDITVDSTSSAESEDYLLNTTSLTFNENGTQNIDLTLYDDPDFDSETIILNIAVSSGTAELGISQHTLTVADDDIPILTITEIMYNSTGTDDEWIEILNNSGVDLDVSGLNIQSVSASGTTLFSYDFPTNTTLVKDEYYTIAVGSNGDGTFNNESPFTPDFNTLGIDNTAVATTNDSNNLNNTAGTITLSTSSSATVDEVAYDDDHDSEADGSGPSYEIIDIDVDNSSTVSNWFSSGSSGGSPGYNGTITWTGNVSSDWSNFLNWNSNVPGTNTNIYIPSGLSTYPSVSSQAACHNLIISSSASLTITEDGFLQTAGDITNNGTLTMNSTASAYSSLIVGGSATGSVTYNRQAEVDRWYIISSPVSGQDIDAFILNEDLAVSANNSTLVGLADYNNDGSQYAADPTITTGWWDYHQSGQTGSGNFTDGKGKIVRLASDATDNLLGFTGTVNGFLSVPLSAATTAFNLVGNPYPAAIQVTSQGGAANDVLSNNASALSEETAWFWNDSGYDAVNQNPSQSAKIAAPGQGFFISAALDFNSNAGNLNFTSSMQTAPTPPSSYQLPWSQLESSGQQLTVNVGDTVRWTWGSGFHNLAQANGETEPGFGEGFFGEFHSYAHTFTTVGSHDYICSPHSGSMYGTITVVQPNNSFNRQTEWSKIDLSMSADSQSSETEIVYFDGA